MFMLDQHVTFMHHGKHTGSSFNAVLSEVHIPLRELCISTIQGCHHYLVSIVS